MYQNINVSYSYVLERIKTTSMKKEGPMVLGQITHPSISADSASETLYISWYITIYVENICINGITYQCENIFLYAKLTDQLLLSSNSSRSSSSSGSDSRSSSNLIPNKMQWIHLCMNNIINRVIIDIVMLFCWWPAEKPWIYQAGS